MLGIFLESWRAGGWLAAVALASGFALGLWPAIKRPGRLAAILLVGLLAVTTIDVVLYFATLNTTWTCRDGGGKLLVELQLWTIVVIVLLMAAIFGMMPAALWRRGNHKLALALLPVLAAALVVIGYLAVFSIGMSAESCLL